MNRRPFSRDKRLPVFLNLAFCLFAVPLRADVQLAGVFGDHMVLQRDLPLSVWGNADAGEKIVVKVAGQTTSTASDSDGHWRVTLVPLQASSTPVDFTVRGKNTVTLQDVLVGDVWLCSGQSNMVYPVYKEQSAAEEMPKADHPAIRLCSFSAKPMREPLADRDLPWSVCTPETVKKFSAVGYFFGSTLQKSIDVPVGLIASAVSGTPAQSWTSLDGLKSDPALQPYLDAYGRMKDKPATGKDPREAAPGTPASLFNGMIAPLTRFGLKGVVWYQGESNAGAADLYRKLLPALIQDWRHRWNQEKLPFLIVQLPGFGRRQPELQPSKWAALREAQAAALALPDTGLAVTIDLSAPRNILHPANKREIGRRLALAARQVAYGEKIESSGPVFKAANVEGSKVRLTFAHTGTGLIAGTTHPTDHNEIANTPGATPKGFAVAGSDQVFVRADAVIEGDTVVVSSEKVSAPVAVRYGWEENPEVNLYNREGLPAAPFRTDTWAIQDPKGKPSDKDETSEPPKF